MLDIGIVVESIITGFNGIITSIIFYETGCEHYKVQPRGVGTDGKELPTTNFPMDILKVLNPNPIISYDKGEPDLRLLGKKVNVKFPKMFGKVVMILKDIKNPPLYAVQPDGTQADGSPLEGAFFHIHNLILPQELQPLKESKVSPPGAEPRKWLEKI